jgi:hypothetical protein
MQVAIINYLAFFQEPRASRGRGHCLFCLTHKGSLLSYLKGESRKEKGEAAGREQTKPEN